MAAITTVVGFGGKVEKRSGPSGAALYVAKVTGGTESPAMTKRSEAQQWLEAHAPVVSKRYRVQIRKPGQPSESKTFSSLRLANAWANKTEGEIEEGRHMPHRRASRILFEKLVERYCQSEHHASRAGSKGDREQHLTWFANRFSGLTLTEITPDKTAEACDALVAEKFTKSPRIPEDVCQQVRALAKVGKTHEQIAEATDQTLGTVRRAIARNAIAPKEYKRSGATVNRYLATLRHLFNIAIDPWRLLNSNPAASKTLRHKEPRGRTRFLSDVERERLLKACGASEWPALRVLVLLALTTGARRGELTGLKWADIDLKTDDGKGGRALVRESKNGEQRTLPLTGKVLEALRAMKREKATRDLQLKAEDRSEWVFQQPSNFPGPFLYFDAHWQAALKAAGLKDMRFHDLRHTTASMLAAQGASLLEIGDVLGHKSAAMTKRYSHLVTDHKAKLIERMAAAKGL